MGDVLAGRYELVDPLGEGGSGVVWRVWDRRERRYLAAKVLRQVDAASLLRFIREQAVRIEHPHVLTPLSWAGEEDKVLFTMPIVRGGSVATLVGDFGSLPPGLAALLLDQLLAALERIHAHGVVHRDVKPANLLLDATGRGLPHLRLSDFGVAAALDEPRLTHGPLTLGTHGYLAPECLQPGWDPDPRADLYAAGMAGLEMVTGQRPPTTRPLEALEALVGSGFPDGLAGVIRGLGEFDPDRRTDSATRARDDLDVTGLLALPLSQALDEVEVFDQVPELPAGWGERGPLPEDAGPRAAVSAPQPSTPQFSAPQPSTAQSPTPKPSTPRPSTPQSPPEANRRGLLVAAALMLTGGLVLLLTAYLAWG